MSYGFNDDKSKAAMPAKKSIQLSNNAEETIGAFFTRVYNAVKDIIDNIAYVKIEGLLAGEYYPNGRGENGVSCTRTNVVKSNSWGGVNRPVAHVDFVFFAKNAASSQGMKFQGYDTDGVPRGTIYESSYSIMSANYITVTVYYWDNI